MYRVLQTLMQAVKSLRSESAGQLHKQWNPPLLWLLYSGPNKTSDSHFLILFNTATPDINMGIHPVILWPISDQINSIPPSSTSFYSENEQQPPPKPMIEQPYN